MRKGYSHLHKFFIDIYFDNTTVTNYPMAALVQETDSPDSPAIPQPDALLLILPLLIVLSTFLFLLLLFLVCVLLIRRRRGISLGDNDGPVDMSREDVFTVDGSFDGIESRWLEGVADVLRRAYLRAKGLLRFRLSVQLSDETRRVPITVSPKLATNRHHLVTVLINPGKGCICLVI